MHWTLFQDSKRAFLHEAVNEEGDKEKLDAFVNFCEDTIFEVLLESSKNVIYGAKMLNNIQCDW